MKMRQIIVVLWLVFALAVPCFASDQPADSEEGGSMLDNLFGKPGEYVWTLVWFIVLMIVLRKFAWKPMLTGLTSRSEHIEKQIDDAEKTRAEAKKVLEEYNAKLADAERQGRDIISVRVKDAEKQAKDVVRQNQRDIEQMKLRAEAELERERIDAEDGLWNQAGDIVRRLGEEIFGKTLDDADNQKLIDEAIARLKSQKSE